jgi:LytR cell envelope-related transcriptional attenuator
MASIPFAFSVHHFINSVGAYAGFAAIIGLAILVLLYFAQARETSSLREQAYEAAQRIAQLENRLTQLSRMPAAPPVQAQPGVPSRPVGAPGREPVPSRAGAPAAVPAAAGAAAATARATPEVGAPAGVGAPALTAATKLIPAGAIVAGAEAFHGAEPDLTTVGSPAPATVAGGANGHATVAPPPPRVQIRPGASAVPPGRRPAPPSRRPPKQGPSTGRRLLAGLLALLVLAGVVVALLVLTSTNDSNTNTSTQAANKSKTASTATNSRHRKAQPAAFSPSSVTVSVLNGTATAQLAHRVATKLAGFGYKEGTVATAADQTRTATVVAYLPGRQPDALAVAKSLKLGPASVQPIDQSTQAVACPPGTACSAGVVVTVGSDLANIQ